MFFPHFLKLNFFNITEVSVQKMFIWFSKTMITIEFKGIVVLNHTVGVRLFITEPFQSKDLKALRMVHI